MRRLFPLIAVLLVATACSENYSNGERVGMIMQFSKTGNFFKSYEGHLNVTQTGMNSSQAFDFSVDNDNEPAGVTALLDSAATLGWKVKLRYHETFGKNWFSNRGHTDFFVTAVDVLDRTPMNFLNRSTTTSTGATSGRAVDTVFVVIVGRSSEGYKRQ